MKHLLVEKFSELNAILERFFQSEATRRSIPKKTIDEEKEVFDLACQIYKRGFLSESSFLSKNLHTKKSYEKPSPSLFQKKFSQKEIFVLVDEGFSQHHPEMQSSFSLKPSESMKNLNTIEKILSAIPNHTQEIFVMGGGITLDMGGFIAGLLNLPLESVPTTLLSAVDASVGGKTGVNFFPYGKNQVGLFYEPCRLYFEPEFLKTLSYEDRCCGVVEASKHAYLFGEFERDLPLFEKILSNTISNSELFQLVDKNFQYKTSVVQQDPQEKTGLRECLNFGHTFAHVLEGLAQGGAIKPISHGVAVAYGMDFLLKQGLVPQKENFSKFLERLLHPFPLVFQKKISKDDLLFFLRQDKKNRHEGLCALSLVSYGCPSFQGTQNFPIQDVVSWMFDYLGLFQRPLTK